MSNNVNPCVSCGACCAAYRVSFYWAEASDGGGGVPVTLTEPLGLMMRNMRGTNDRAPRCVALAGEIGQCVSCKIYADRPSPCREFSLSGDNGVVNDRCDRARARHGLPPLDAWRFSTPDESYVSQGASPVPDHVQSAGL
ncbi:YkgJ family cysteine cluster protein [Pantoea sp. 1.19]|uniref:YkgJ family cysteine cluster protein n=1 Tax=Pantoea sp. 1.19 TaxID=1925589 RepID=UPI000948A09F|nr:YkgJ family cysteine cluster protein [Pantoea sp. 1.19]